MARFAPLSAAWRAPARARADADVGGRATVVHWAALGAALAVLLATAWAYAHGAGTYMDNGDGLYLYPAYRLARGAVLYRDVMGTQPPVVYLIGAIAWKAALPLTGIRLAGLAMRALCVALVYALGRALSLGRAVAASGALLYALLPIGLAWDRSTNSNSPLTLVILLAACALARLTPRAALASGLLAALGLFTKDLYLPVLAATVVYLARWRRPLLLPYASGLVAGIVAGMGALILYAGPRGLRDAFLGQASSPINAAWPVASAAYVAAQEGGIVLLAVAGAYLLVRRGAAHPPEPAHGGAVAARRAYAPYLLAGSAAVLLATLKEGTFGTVSACAEPAVALLAAYALGVAARAILEYPVGPPAPAITAPEYAAAAAPAIGDTLAHETGRRAAGAPGGLRSSRGLCRIMCAGPLLLLALPSIADVIGHDRVALSLDNTAEVGRVAGLVRAHARPGSLILAPPYYAVLTGTRIPYDASDTYILLRQARDGDVVSARRVRAIVRDVAAGRFPIVVEDAHIAAFPSIERALRAAYRPAYADGLTPSVHAVVWLPTRR